MTDQEEISLAHRLAEGSKAFDFESAREFVRYRPAEAEKLIRNRAERKKRQADLARAFEGLRAAARELR
jgi:hypothetical protein